LRLFGESHRDKTKKKTQKTKTLEKNKRPLNSLEEAPRRKQKKREETNK
jgi:hypothetical protein